MRAGMEGCDGAHPRRGDVRGRHPRQAAPGDVRGQRARHRARARAPPRTPRSRKIVYVSTVGTFGNTHGKVVDETYEHPGKEFTSYYEETKLEGQRVAERMIAEEGLPCVIVQPGGVYGPGDTSQVADLLEEFFAGRLCLMPFPELGICLTHVEDIAAGILLALDKGKAGETYVISGPATTMREAIETIADVSGRKAPKRAMPTALMKAMTPIGPLVGKMMGQPPNLRELISSADGVTFWASYEKASRELGYAPRGMEEGMRQTLEADERFPAPRRLSEPPRRRMRVIDVKHLGRPHVIGCWEVDGMLVDPGPESSMETLLAALGDEQPRALLLTHIHLDHAAATGALVRRWPSSRSTSTSVAPPPDRPVEAAGQRRAPLRRPDGAPLGRDRARARGEREAAGRRREPCSACASPTRPATPPITSATCTRRAAPPSSATSPPSAFPPPT